MTSSVCFHHLCVTLAMSISYTDQVPEYSNTSNNKGLHGQNERMNEEVRDVQMYPNNFETMGLCKLT